MLNREEYNVAFKTTLSQEEFDEIMGKPITDLSEVEELVIADRKGNVWRFLPKANAIPKEWILNKYREKWEKAEMGRRDFQFCEAIHDLLEMWDEEKEDWEKENE